MSQTATRKLRVATTSLLQLPVVDAPPLQAGFRTVGLPARTLGLGAAASAVVLLAVEAGKLTRGLARGAARE